MKIKKYQAFEALYGNKTSDYNIITNNDVTIIDDLFLTFVDDYFMIEMKKLEDVDGIYYKFDLDNGHRIQYSFRRNFEMINRDFLIRIEIPNLHDKADFGTKNYRKMIRDLSVGFKNKLNKFGMDILKFTQGETNVNYRSDVDPGIGQNDFDGFVNHQMGDDDDFDAFNDNHEEGVCTSIITILIVKPK